MTASSEEATEEEDRERIDQSAVEELAVVGKGTAAMDLMQKHSV